MPIEPVPPDTPAATPLRDRLRSLLDDLGGTAAEVAAALLRAGVTGRRGSTCDCPLAEYLRARGVPCPLVYATFVSAGERDLPAFAGSTGGRDPWSCFACQFDAGLWPELEER